MTVATAQDTPSAPVATGSIEVELPEGLLLPTLEELTAPAAPSTATPGADQARTPSAPSPTAPGQPSQRERDAVAARDEERGKRKRLADQFRTLKGQYDELASRRTAVPFTRETPEQRKARLAKLRGNVVARLPGLKEKADKADTVGAVAELVLTTVLDHLDERHMELLDQMDARDQSFVNQINVARSDIDEKLFRRDHPDYDETLRKAGVFEAIQVLPTGQFRDPVIARQIYTKDNHAQAAYAVAQSKLAFEAEERGEEPTASAPGTPPAAPAAPAGPESIAEAERRGRRDAFDAMAQTGNHAQGVRSLPPAGGPRRAIISKEFLDELAEKRPNEYLALMDKNPELERWHLS